MKKLLLLNALLFLASSNIFAQKSQGIGTNTPNPRAVLDITVENPATYPQGLLLPRLTTTERTLLGSNLSPTQTGMAVYDTFDKNFYTWDGTQWKSNGSIVNTIIGTGGILVSNVSGNFTISGGSQWTTSGANIYYNTGNVGVGTSTPSYRLDINGNIGMSGTGNRQLIFGRSTTEAIEFLQNTSNTNGPYFTMHGSNRPTFEGRMEFVSNSSNAAADAGTMVFMRWDGSIFKNNMYFNKQGDLLVGETGVPSAKLDVNGNARIRNLSVSGAVLTVDGLGNVGMGTIAPGIGGSGTINGIAYFTNNNTITADGTNFSFTKGNFMELKLGFTTIRSSTANGDNLLVGRDAGNTLTTGNSNSVFGFRSGENMNTGSQNSFFGYNSGQNSSGAGVQSNSYFGYNSGQNTTGQQNSFFGHSTGTAASTGNENSFFGHTAGQFTTSSSNSFFGKGAGGGNLGGAENSFFGRSAGAGNTTGGNNSFFGRSAGIANVSGVNNIAIGHSANFGFPNLNNSIAIGSNVIASGSNQAVIGSNITGLGINTNSPTAMLDVNGGARIRTLTNTGAVLTVDGLGNLGMGSMPLSAPSQWISTTSGIYVTSFVGINNNNPLFPLQVGVSPISSPIASFEGVVKARVNSNLSTQSNLDLENLNGMPSAVVAINFNSLNSVSSLRTGSKIVTSLSDNTSGAEKGVFAIQTIHNGTLEEKLRVSSVGAVGIGVQTFTGYEALRIGGSNPTSPKGLVFPYVTTAQMVVLTAQLGALDAGMVFYNTQRKDVEIWDGTQWQSRGGDEGGGGNNDFNQTWNIFGNNSIGGTNMSVSGFGRMGTADNYGLAIQTNNQTRIFLNTIGGVGINEFLPKAQLQVNGDLGLGNGTESGNKPVVVWLKNFSGSTRNPGEIVVIAPGDDDSFVLSTISNDNRVLGVLTETCNNLQACKVAISGVVTVNVTLPITRGQHCVTSTTAGSAQGTGTPNVGSSIGVFLQSVSAGTTARVLLR